jgi:hypothetical protein
LIVRAFAQELLSMEKWKFILKKEIGKDGINTISDHKRCD